MKKLIQPGALLLGASLIIQSISSGHGGTYRGPGDTVPPGGGGGGGGSGAAPTGPSPSGPSGGNPSGPAVPTGSGPGGAKTGGANQPGGNTTGGTTGSDLSTWQFWWEFNKDQYLNLKSAIYSGPVTDDADSLFGNGSVSKAKHLLKPSEERIRGKLVPALKEALEKERNNDIVTGCLIALGKVGDAKNEDGKSEFEGIMKKFLPDGQQEIAETAAVALGILANDDSVETLANLARDSEAGRKLVGTHEVKWRTRAFSIYGLGLIGSRSANNEVRQHIVDFLVDLLAKNDSATRDVKVAALIALGLVPIDIDKGGLQGKAGASSSRQAEIKFVETYFSTETNPHEIRAHAPTTLARLMKAAPVELKESVARQLVDALGLHSQEKDDVQQSCVLALGMLGDSDMDKIDVDIREALMRITEKGEQQSRAFALIALGQIGGRQGQGEGNEQGVKLVRNFLLTELTKGKSQLRPWAGLGIGVMERAILENPAGGQLSSGDAKTAVRTALKETNTADLIGAYSIALGIAKDSDSKDVLMDKLDKTAEQNAKGYVAVGLGLMDARDAIKKIETIVHESKYRPDLLKQAAIGLGLLGDKDLVAEMIVMLKEAKSLNSQAAVASALGFIGDSRSIDPLVEMIKNKEISASARGFAAVALGIVADKEPFPWNSKISTNINYRANTPSLTDGQAGILDIL